MDWRGLCAGNSEPHLEIVLDFYYLARKDGVYDVICMRCLKTVLSTTNPSSSQDPQTLHQCVATLRQTAPIAAPLQITRSAETLAAIGAQLQSVRASILLVLGVLLLYGLPTIVECLLLHSSAGCIGVVLIGDLAGCACIVLLFRRWRLAVAVYLWMTALEGAVYGLGLLPADALPWVVDLVPTLLALSLLYQWRQSENRRGRLLH